MRNSGIDHGHDQLLGIQLVVLNLGRVVDYGNDHPPFIAVVLHLSLDADLLEDVGPLVVVTEAL